MLKTTIDRLTYLLDTIPTLLNNITESDFSLKPAPDKWSKKEIIGHLIDSAANNHQRFVRGQFEEEPLITYNQDNWNMYSFHQQNSQEAIIRFWEMYNRQILFIIQRIQPEQLRRSCRTPDAKTLQWLIEDYVVHMEHHLHEVIDYQ